MGLVRCTLRLKPHITHEDHFWSKVDIRSSLECWPWKGTLLIKGYGVLCYKQKRMMAAHLSLLFNHSLTVPEGMFVCHTCDNPICVNPSHLFIGNNSDNMRDAVSKGRHFQIKKTHCPKGHEYSIDNTYHGVNKKGRNCRKCHTIAATEYNQRVRERRNSL